MDNFQEYTVEKRVRIKSYTNYDLSKQMKPNYKYSKEKLSEFKFRQISFLLLI